MSIHEDHPQLSLVYLLRRPEGDATHPPVIILLHGYGSNEADLFDLAPTLPSEFLVIAARAPRTLTAGAYAWFSLDFSSGAPRGNDAEAETSRLLLKRFVDEVIEKFSVDPARIFFLGFSQGAMMSLSVALTFPRLANGVVALSGRILPSIRPLVHATAELKKLNIFLGHGTEDDVLPIRYAHEAREYLKELGVELTYNEYPIGHSISHREQLDVVGWLQKNL